MGKKNGRNAEGQAPATDAPPAQQGGGERKPPVAEFRLGRVKVTIWQNESEANGKWFSIVPARTYKKEDGNWASAHSFGRDDCLPLAECMRQALLWINQQYGGGWRKQGDQGPEQQGTETSLPVTDDIPF